jgi:2-haloacid dehalogenase
MSTVAFDLNGTLLDPSAIAGAFGGTDDDVALVMAAFDDTVVQAMAATLAGRFPPFLDLLRAGMEHRLALAGREAGGVDNAVERAAALPAFPDAAGALDRLRAAGQRLAVVSNSATDSAEASLERAGLRDRFAVVVGADQVRAYKPDRRLYARLLDALDEEPGEVWLVAAHWWDIRGASAAGLRTAWVARKEGHLLGGAGAADRVGADLHAIADVIATA